MMAGHVSPEAQVGGPLAVLNDGDIVTVDAEHGLLEVELSHTEIKSRLKNWEPPELKYKRGVLFKYAKLVHSAAEGAVCY